MGTPFDIQVVLTEQEVRTALAQYIAVKLGGGFSVHPSKIEFEVAAGQKLNRVIAKAVQTIKPLMPTDPWTQPG